MENVVYDRKRPAHSIASCISNAWMADVGDDGSLRLWDLSERRRYSPMIRHIPAPVKCISADLCGDLLVAGMDNGSVSVFTIDIETVLRNHVLLDRRSTIHSVRIVLEVVPSVAVACSGNIVTVFYIDNPEIKVQSCPFGDRTVDDAIVISQDGIQAMLAVSRSNNNVLSICKTDLGDITGEHRWEDEITVKGVKKVYDISTSGTLMVQQNTFTRIDFVDGITGGGLDHCTAYGEGGTKRDFMTWDLQYRDSSWSWSAKSIYDRYAAARNSIQEYRPSTKNIWRPFFTNNRSANEDISLPALGEREEDNGIGFCCIINNAVITVR